MARFQIYSGKPFIKRNPSLGANTEEVPFPNLGASPGTPATGMYARRGKSQSIYIAAVGGGIQFNFDKDATNFVTLATGQSLMMDIEAASIFITGQVAGSGYELFVELSHG